MKVPQTKHFVFFAGEDGVKLIKTDKSVVVDKCNLLGFRTKIVEILISHEGFDWKIIVRI